jgi:hypothetical protein
MTKVFIGGSRRVSRLNADVRRRIDRIIDQGFPVLVGDANGADKAVQKYLQSRGYEAVEVFCSGGECRNNVGKWPVRAVATSQTRRDFDYYAAKDEQMAQEASVARLLRQDKRVVVYATSSKRLLTLKVEADLEPLISACARNVQEKVLRSASGARRQSGGAQSSLL